LKLLKKKSARVSKQKEKSIIGINASKSKKKKIVISSVLFLLFSLFIGVLISETEINDPNNELRIVFENLFIERNDSNILEFYDDESERLMTFNDVVCSSSDEQIATVINGKIFALSEGETSITCDTQEILSNPFRVTVTSTVLSQSDNQNTTAPSNPTENPSSVNPTIPSEPSTKPSTNDTADSNTPTTPKENPTPVTPTAPSDALLIVSYIDVGQGDSILIQTPNNKNILIDAGTSSYGPKISNYLRSRGINKIDVLIATHPHADHIGGMSHIIENFNIGSIYMPNVASTTKTFENLLLTIQSKGLTIKTAKAGVLIEIDSAVTAQLIAPNSSKYNDVNQYSAVLKVTYNATSFIFTGDAGQLSEQEMLNSGYNLKADVLKVGHHGSSTSTTQAFLSAIAPKYAIITVGANNRYGHPNDLVLNRLADMGVTIYRTDLDGTIIISSDGRNIYANN
jgi:competence protein ComEC